MLDLSAWGHTSGRPEEEEEEEPKHWFLYLHFVFITASLALKNLFICWRTYKVLCATFVHIYPGFCKIMTKKQKVLSIVGDKLHDHSWETTKWWVTGDIGDIGDIGVMFR